MTKNRNCHYYNECRKAAQLCTDKCDKYIDRICGNCASFTGEECDGTYEGAERYHDSEACASWERERYANGEITCER
jgi:hypothetical protein